MVGFVESPTETIEVQHRSDMSVEAISNTWYSQDEISGMISESSRACFLLQRSKYLGETDDDFCHRGLEHIFLPDYRVRRQKVMRDAKDAVVLEQDRQLTNNSFNEELIAATYGEAVLYATKVARRRGLRDEDEIHGDPKLESKSHPSKKKARKPGLKVTFNDSTYSKTIACLQSISKEEKSSCWIGRSEYVGMKQSAINDIKNYMSGRAPESDDFTVRGLESYLPNLSMIRNRNRVHAVNAVFEEQELQELEGATCPARIAKAYQSNSVHCLLVAQVRAQQDAIGPSTPLADTKTRKAVQPGDQGDCYRPYANKWLVPHTCPNTKSGKTQFHRVHCS